MPGQYRISTRVLFNELQNKGTSNVHRQRLRLATSDAQVRWPPCTRALLSQTRPGKVAWTASSLSLAEASLCLLCGRSVAFVSRQPHLFDAFFYGDLLAYILNLDSICCPGFVLPLLQLSMCAERGGNACMQAAHATAALARRVHMQSSTGGGRGILIDPDISRCMQLTQVPSCSSECCTVLLSSHACK